MSGAKREPFSSYEIDILDRLISTAGYKFSPPVRRKLWAWWASSQGMPDAKIVEMLARQEKISPQAIYRILAKPAKIRSLAIFNCAFPGMANPGMTKEKVVPGPRGRPKPKTLSGLANQTDPENESVFELATLFVSKNVRVASIALRQGSILEPSKAPSTIEKSNSLSEGLKEDLKKTLAKIDRASEKDIHWTRASILDSHLSEIFTFLKQGLNNQADPLSKKGAEIVLKPLSERFDSRFAHIVFAEGPEKIWAPIIQNLTKDVRSDVVRSRNNIPLLRHLEAALHQRRLERSCIGLLPSIWQLRIEVLYWAQANQPRHFEWQVSQDSIHKWIGAHAVTKDYFAAGGAISEMWGLLPKKIPFQDNFKLTKVSDPTHLKLVGVSPLNKEGTLEITPLLNFPYLVSIPWKGSEGALLEKGKNKIEASADANYFVYSAQGGDSNFRKSIRLHDGYFLDKEDRHSPGPIKVVLFPRHYLTTHPIHSLSNLDSLAARTGSGVNVAECPTGEGQLIFHLPEVIEELRRALKKGQVQKKLEELSQWQEEIWFRAHGRGFPSVVFQRMRPLAILGRDSWDHGSVDENANNVGCERDLQNLLTHVDADFLLSFCGKKVQTRIKQAAERWYEETVKVVQSVYFVNGKPNLPYMRAMVKEKHWEGFFARSDIVASCFYGQFGKLTTNKRLVVRTAMENMQRLALAGFGPHPIVVEKSKDVLARWSAFLKIALNKQLDGRAPRKKGYREKDVDRIVYLIESLIKEPSKTKWEAFFGHMEIPNSEAWAKVIARLEPVQQQMIKNAFRIIHEGGGELTPAVQEDLEECFQNSKRN